MKKPAMFFNSHKSYLLFLFLIITTVVPILSQPSDLDAYIREKHGYDQNLINGIVYYDKYKQVLNHPFYGGEKVLSGSVVISGISYKDVQINYDIYSQQLILEYHTITGGVYPLVISPEHIDAFQLDGYYFERLNLDGRGPRFYQNIKVNGLTCYIHWEKKIETASYQYTSRFTEPEQSFYLDYDGNLSPFSNRKSFVSLLSGLPKKEIKSYIRKNQIHFSNATPEQIESLMKFISSTIKSTSGN